MDGARAQKMDNFAECRALERGHQVADITSGRIILQINIVPPPPNTKYNTVTALSARKLKDIGE